MITHEARGRLAAGDFASLSRQADALIARHPGSGDGHYFAFLALLGQGQPSAAFEQLTLAARLRSLDWLLERLRADLPRCNLGPRQAFAVGATLRRLAPVLGESRDARGDEHDHEYVNVVGASVARCFGYDSVFFPVMVGAGNNLLATTDEAAAILRADTMAIVRRLDPRRHLVLIASPEPHCHVQNIGPHCRFFETDPALPLEEQRIRGVDVGRMEAAAGRYVPFLAELCDAIAGGVTVLATPPTFWPNINQLVRVYNARLGQVCRRVGVGFLDLYEEFSDPATGCMKPTISANGMEKDSHFNAAGLALVKRALTRAGVLRDPRRADRLDYDWTNVFDFQILPREPSRIWCEPNVQPANALQSQKIASTFVANRLADYLVFRLATCPDGSLLLLNARDGLLPVITPMPVKAEAVAVSVRETDYRALRRVLAFAGRADVWPLRAAEARRRSVELQHADLAAVCFYPDTTGEEEDTVLDLLRAFRPRTVLVSTPAGTHAARLAALGYRIVATQDIGNKIIHEKWRSFAIVEAVLEAERVQAVEASRAPAPPAVGSLSIIERRYALPVGAEAVHAGNGALVSAAEGGVRVVTPPHPTAFAALPLPQDPRVAAEDVREVSIEVACTLEQGGIALALVDGARRELLSDSCILEAPAAGRRTVVLQSIGQRWPGYLLIRSADAVSGGALSLDALTLSACVEVESRPGAPG
jgi:hypothetical protein